MKISVITVAYNSASTIRDTIDSVLAQDYPCIEHLIIDGASSDSTLSIVSSYESPTIRFISEPDRGIYDALNKGIRLATGGIVGFLHADDIFADGSVLSEIAVRFQNPAVEAVYGDLVYVDAKDVTKIVRSWKAGEFTSKRLSQGWMPPHPTLYARLSVYERLGNFDTRYRIAADYDSIVRLFGAGAVCPVYLPRLLVRMRVGGVSNRSIKTIWLKSFEDLDVMRRHKIGGLPTLLRKNLSKLHQFWRR
jgi:glycosyltransferase